MADYFPIFAKIDEAHKILIVGGGSVATAKLEALIEHKEYIRIKALSFRDDLKALCEKQNISYKIGSFEEKDLENCLLVIAATDNKELNQEIKKQANNKNILVNVVDDKELCDFIFPALVKRGDLTIAISTAGISPVLSRFLKRTIETVIPENFTHLIEFLKDKREIVQQKLKNLQPRRIFWENFLSSPTVQKIFSGKLTIAEKEFYEALETENNQAKASLYLISAGCGDPDLITVKGTQLLSRADIVLYDRLVAPSLLDRYARKDAVKIEVGKKRGLHTLKQQDIDSLIKDYLEKGKIVARLKGGDSGIFAHASEEIDIAKSVGADWQIVPGITAAIGCAAYSGIPLTQRDVVRSVRLITLYDKDIYNEEIWRNLASSETETLVFYMSLKHKKLMCEKLIHYGLPKNLGIMAVEQGTTLEHRSYVSTLENFCKDYKDIDFISPTLFIVSKTVDYAKKHAWFEELGNNKKSFFEEKQITGGCKDEY